MVKNPSKRLFILLASSIFAGEFLIMVLFKWWQPNTSFATTALLDASLLVFFTAFFLQRYLIKPITKLVAGFQDAKNELRINAQAFETEEGIIIADPQFTIIRVNKAFERITGFKASYAVGKPVVEFNCYPHNQELHQDILKQIAKTGIWSGESAGIRVDGQEFPRQMSISEVRNPNGELTEYVSIFSDITHKKEYEEKLHRLAYFDSVTNLPNRELLLINIEKGFEKSEHTHQYGTLIVLEPDNFRMLTETNSYLMGDLFLAKISARLKDEVPSNCRVYRIHGNEFAILLDDIGSKLNLVKKNVGHITSIIDSIFSSPFTINDYEHHSTVSVGIVIFLGHQFTINHLFKAAEVSLRQASNVEGE
jgi:PAS domain S-box-containing protein/diguanylate cyclase (GGDEF)-like protein